MHVWEKMSEYQAKSVTLDRSALWKITEYTIRLTLFLKFRGFFSLRWFLYLITSFIHQPHLKIR